MPNPWRFDMRRAFVAILACLVPALALAFAARAEAAPRPPVGARAGLDIAVAAAQSWSPDAALIYLENDEDVDEHGASVRWGYLFYSPSTRKARVYSVRDGKILTAANLELKFEAPPVDAGWIDSGAAREAAEREAGQVFKKSNGGTLSTMLLMRGAFDESKPDRTTWTLVYTSPNEPSLFVVVDAAEGKVRKTWRG
jgi:hypothetical protein